MVVNVAVLFLFFLFLFQKYIYKTGNYLFARQTNEA